MKFETYVHKIVIDHQPNFHKDPCKDAHARGENALKAGFPKKISPFFLLLSHDNRLTWNYSIFTASYDDYSCQNLTKKVSEDVFDRGVVFILWYLRFFNCNAILKLPDFSHIYVTLNMTIKKQARHGRIHFDELELLLCDVNPCYLCYGGMKRHLPT